MNAELINREFEAYRRDEQEARAILDAADTENRATTPEEDERFDRLTDSAGKHKVRADKLAEMDRNSAALADAVRAQVGDPSDPDSGEPTEALGTDAQLRANVTAVQAMIRRGGDIRELVFDARVDLEKRAIADFSDNGALYTTDFATRVAVYQRTASPWINLASVINADNGRPLNLPRETADGTAYTPGEGTAITESTPTIGSAALTTAAYKALSYVSAEAEEDELIGLLGLIAKSQGRTIGLKFGSVLSAAVISAATNGGTATGTGGNGTAVVTFFGYEDLIDLKYGRAVPYRQAGSWVMANGAIVKVRKFKDQNGNYFWQPAIGPGMAPTFDGDAVYEDPYLAAVASASKSVVYGDVSALVVKQMALRIATSSDFKFDTDQVAIKTVYRAGGALPDAAALAYLVSATS